MPVTLFHPDLKVTIEVTREAKAKILERSGWQRVQDERAYEPPLIQLMRTSEERGLYNDEFVLEDEDTNQEETQ